MNMKMNLKIAWLKRFNALLIVSAVASAAPAFAAGTYDSHKVGGYAGATYGVLKFSDDDDFDREDDAFKLFGGVKLNQVLSIEGSFLDFGSYDNPVIDGDTDGFALAVRGDFPILHNTSLFAQGGMLWWETEFETLGFNGDVNGNDPFVTVGASFSMSELVDVQVDYTRYKVDFEDSSNTLLSQSGAEAEIDSANIGVKFKF